VAIAAAGIAKCREVASFWAIVLPPACRTTRGESNARTAVARPDAITAIHAEQAGFRGRLLPFPPMGDRLAPLRCAGAARQCAAPARAETGDLRRVRVHRVDGAAEAGAEQAADREITSGPGVEADRNRWYRDSADRSWKNRVSAAPSSRRAGRT